MEGVHMKSSKALVCVAVAVILVLASADICAETKQADSSRNHWTDSFHLESCNFSDTGRNTYFILEPGFQLILKGLEDNDSVTLVITVTSETQQIDGIPTRIVEERESSNGELIEVSRNFFSFCRATGSVFYFGEDVDIYEGGKIVGHEGAWHAGENGFKPGLMMPGLVLAGSSYYQEIAPGVAMDRARIVNADTTIQTPSRIFEHCLITEETSALEPDSRERKYYAPGIGLIKDGQLWLVTKGVVDKEK